MYYSPRFYASLPPFSFHVSLFTLRQYNISMNQFNLSNLINKFFNYSLLNSKGKNPNILNPNINPDMKFQLTNEAMTQNMMQQPASHNVLNTFSFSTLADLKMNHLASLERGLYIKDLMNLPKKIEEILVLVQNNAAAAKDLKELLTKNINLASLAELIKEGGKEAMNKLVLVMASASKQGITDLSQIKDAIKFINASVSVAGQNDTEKILKTFMLLYLPWLPLQEGVDFDLEIESSQGEEGDSELSITIMISTRNYGNVRVTLILLAGNSMSIIINCSEEFPKDELLKRINTENKKHSIQSDVTFEQKAMKTDENATRQAKISMSNLMEVNPFLLLMANAIIRHTIEIDNQAG